MFSALSKTKIIILSTLILSSVNVFNLDRSKILSFGKELIATFQLSPAASLNLGQSQNSIIIGEWVKLKAFADSKINVNEKLKIWFRNGKKHCGKKGKILVTSILSFPPPCFQKPFVSGSLKVEIVW